MRLRQLVMDTYEELKSMEQDIIESVRASPDAKLDGFWAYYYKHLCEYDPAKAERIIKADDKLAVRLGIIPCTLDEELDDAWDEWDEEAIRGEIDTPTTDEMMDNEWRWRGGDDDD